MGPESTARRMLVAMGDAAPVFRQKVYEPEGGFLRRLLIALGDLSPAFSLHGTDDASTRAAESAPCPEEVGESNRAVPMPRGSVRTPENESLLTPAEVATMFGVDPKTITRWAKAGKLTGIRTLGGHRRYRETEIRALLAGGVKQPRRK